MNKNIFIGIVMCLIMIAPVLSLTLSYDKTNINILLENYYTKLETYNQTEIDLLINNIELELLNYYNSSEVDLLLSSLNVSVNLSDYYNITQIDNLLNNISSSVWTESGTNIYYNDGNVGIGTATPSQKLEVNGNVNTGNIVNIIGGSPRFLLMDTSSGTNWQIMNNNFNLGFWGNGASTLYVTFKNMGNVGIGTADPTEKLEVNGNVKVINRVTADEVNAKIYNVNSVTNSNYPILLSTNVNNYAIPVSANLVTVNPGTNSLSASNIYANNFYGDGSGLTNVLGLTHFNSKMDEWVLDSINPPTWNNVGFGYEESRIGYYSFLVNDSIHLVLEITDDATNIVSKSVYAYINFVLVNEPIISGIANFQIDYTYASCMENFGDEYNTVYPTKNIDNKGQWTDLHTELVDITPLTNTLINKGKYVMKVTFIDSDFGEADFPEISILSVGIIIGD